MRNNPLCLILLSAAGIGMTLPAGLHAADAPAAKSAAPAKPVTFAEVRPLLDKYCYTCHGGPLAPSNTPTTSRTKGGLTLDTPENALKGGRSKKPGITPGKPDESEVIRRIKLSPTDKDIMPQKGKPVPTADEIKKLVDWVSSGASWQ